MRITNNKFNFWRICNLLLDIAMICATSYNEKNH